MQNNKIDIEKKKQMLMKIEKQNTILYIKQKQQKKHLLAFSISSKDFHGQTEKTSKLQSRTVQENVKNKIFQIPS